MKVAKLTRLVLGLAIALGFLWLLLRQIKIEDLLNGYRGGNAALIAAAIASFAVGYSCRVERWRLMLSQTNAELGWSDCFGPFMCSVAANNVLPLRAGDMLRAVAFNKRLGVDAAASISSLIVERLLDVMMMLVFLGLACALFGPEYHRLLGVGSMILFAAGAGILVTVLFPTSLKPIAIVIADLITTISTKAGAYLRAAIDRLFPALEALSMRYVMAKLFAWSLLAWTAEGVVFWLVALSLTSIIAPHGAWLAFPIGTFATLIPSTPGYVGTFDFFTAKAMAAAGNAEIPAAAYALLVHMILWIPATLIGGLYFLKELRRRIASLEAPQQ